MRYTAHAYTAHAYRFKLGRPRRAFGLADLAWGQAFGEALGAGPLPPSSGVYTAILAERAAGLLRMQVTRHARRRRAVRQEGKGGGEWLSRLNQELG